MTAPVTASRGDSPRDCFSRQAVIVSPSPTARRCLRKGQHSGRPARFPVGDKAGLRVGDDVAAIAAAGVIAWNGFHLLRPALNELMDSAPGREIVDRIQKLAEAVSGVERVEKCLVRKAGYGIVNIDSTLCLQAPKIKDYIPLMQAAIAQILSLNINDVSIKATTTEKMGFVGREEGLVAYASILLHKQV